MAGMERYSTYEASEPTLRERRFQTQFAGPDGNILSVDRNLHLDTKSDVNSPKDNDKSVKRYVGIGVALTSIITENLLSHPFVVLRRQCQVHNDSSRYHLVPITLVPVIYHLHQRQGITTLWKGIGSVLLVRGMSMGLEDMISKMTPWPKEVTWQSSWKAMGQHMLLKCTSLALITPFYSASLVETVQSDIASEKPGIFDVFKEGMRRLVRWGAPHKGRMLPVWSLVVPTVMYGLFKYVFSSIVRAISRRCMRDKRKREQQKKGALSKELSSSATQDIEISASLIGMITADVVFFPLETILHRLHLQGTRTIIDNLDSGVEVMPILTSYEGPSDCYELTLQQEGFSGLYKGFGALLLQFAAHVAVIKLTKFVLTEVSCLLRSTSKPTVRPAPSFQDVTLPAYQKPVEYQEPAAVPESDYAGYTGYNNYQYRDLEYRPRF